MNDQQELFEKILANTLSIDPYIAVYQRNRWAIAERALSISFPTVYQLLGDGFTLLAQKFLLVEPNANADWGAWGENFPDFIKTTPLETALPYLSDCATLDWYIHATERSNNSVMDTNTLALFINTDPKQIYVRLNKNIKLMKSHYPLYVIWKMHQQQESASYWADIAKKTLHSTNGNTEYLIIFREDWRATPLSISENEYRFMQLLNGGNSLSIALDALINTDFNFTEWLVSAVKFHWIASIS